MLTQDISYGVLLGPGIYLLEDQHRMELPGCSGALHQGLQVNLALQETRTNEMTLNNSNESRGQSQADARSH